MTLILKNLNLSSSCRIIAGKWRGRRIHFSSDALANIRPTPDRVRETVFNWLAHYLPQAYCLDLFSGSGALGFESLSRGANHVIMVDQSLSVIQTLRETAQKLNTENITLYQGCAPDKITLPNKPFDIIFLDPPFHQNLIQKTCYWLETQKLIHQNSLIYIELENTLNLLSILPSKNWMILKQGKTRQVGYYLVKIKCNYH